jgi:hypothetical protein
VKSDRRHTIKNFDDDDDDGDEEEKYRRMKEKPTQIFSYSKKKLSKE